MRVSPYESSVVAGLHEQTHTPTYKTMNWLAYNKELKRRGSLTIRWPAGGCLQSPQGWFDPEMTWAAKPTGRRGRQPIYSDAAVQSCLTMTALFGMALRQIEPWKRRWSE